VLPVESICDTFELKYLSCYIMQTCEISCRLSLIITTLPWGCLALVLK